jgi:hypothetical protein
MSFYIGQTFDKTYPPQAAIWCNSNNAHIEKNGDVYIIVENAKPIPTKAELTAFDPETLTAELNHTKSQLELLENEKLYHSEKLQKELDSLRQKKNDDGEDDDWFSDDDKEKKAVEKIEKELAEVKQQSDDLKHQQQEYQQ